MVSRHLRNVQTPLVAGRRRGMSLLELLLVVAVLSAVVAISWPALRRPMNRNHIESGARQLQADVLTARNRAMNSREVYVFMYRVNSDEYLICSLRSLRSAGLPSPLETARRDEFADKPDDRELKQLPDGIWFTQQNPPVASVNQRLDSELNDSQSVEYQRANESGQANWSQPMLFYPSGRLQSGTVQLGSDQDYLIDISIDGLGGRVKIQNLRRSSSENTDSPRSIRSTGDLGEEN